ncbi:MAG: LEPR-XLL domain-containing protein [Isosphaeraceae bacterium]
MPGSRRLQRPGVEALESRVLLSASEPLTTLIKLPAVIVLKAPHQLVPAQTDPAVKAVSLLPQNGAAGQVNVVQSAAQGVTGSAGTTPKVVNIVPAPTHSISLQYSFNGIVSSSSPVFTSTLMSSTTGPVVAPDPEAASSESTGMEPPAVAIAAAGARLTTHVEVAAPGVSVGPLVTRGSAPLRPPLGTTPGEPTPSIDRNERAFDLAALGSGAEVDAELLLGLTTNRSDGNGEDTPVNPATRTTEPLIALRGPGGLPVMVSSVRAGQSLTDPAAVLATLPAPENLPDPGQQLARLPALPPLDVPGALRRGDEVACIDFLKAACGLMLGIGLTTGPLYPDLMALVRNFLPRRASLANAPRRSGARRKGLLRGFRRWLGLC